MNLPVNVPTPWGNLQFVYSPGYRIIARAISDTCFCKLCSISRIQRTYNMQSYKLENYYDFM